MMRVIVVLGGFIRQFVGVLEDTDTDNALLNVHTIIDPIVVFAITALVAVVVSQVAVGHKRCFYTFHYFHFEVQAGRVDIVI